MSREDVMKIEENGRSQQTPQEKYDKKNTKTYAIKVIKTTEPDIFSKLENEPNKSGYIKKLIRKDINSNNKENIYEEGMTDHQFKAFLILLRDSIEVKEKQEVIKMLDEMIKR